MVSTPSFRKSPTSRPPIEFSKAVRRVALLANERYGRAVKLSLSQGKLDLSTKAEVGEAQESVPVEYDGSEVTIGRWLTPVISRRRSRKSASRSSVRKNCRMVTSWHRPTVLTDVLADIREATEKGGKDFDPGIFTAEQAPDIPRALSLNVLHNQDWVWGVALMVSGLFFAVAVLYHGVARFRREARAVAASPRRCMSGCAQW